MQTKQELIKEIADKINGSEYREEISEELAIILKENNLVAVYGASDDLCEFEGAYSDELSAWDGNTFLWVDDHFIEEDSEEAEDLEDKPYFYINQIWCPDEEKSWGFETNIPNAEKFVIMEDGEIYGEGLVFCLDDLKINQN